MANISIPTPPEDQPDRGPEVLTSECNYRRIKFNATSWNRFVLVIDGERYFYNQFKDVTDEIDRLYLSVMN